MNTNNFKIEQLNIFQENKKEVESFNIPEDLRQIAEGTLKPCESFWRGCQGSEAHVGGW